MVNSRASNIGAASDRDDQLHIRAVLKHINDLWLSGRPAALPAGLESVLHPKAVFRGAGGEELCRGSAACIVSYQEMSASIQVSQVLGWHFTGLHVDVAGDTAVASYGWRLAYRHGKRTYHQAGRDIFGFTRYDRRWLVCWRTTSTTHAK